VAVAVLVYVYALRLDVWALAGLAAVVLVGGLVLADRGPRGLRAAAPSLLIALFIVPPPSLAIDFAQSQLTGLVARTSCWILSWFLGSEQVVLRGTDLHFGDAYVSIVDDCSGLGGILIAPPFALLLLLLARVPFGWPWLAILVVSTFLAAFANLVRVVTGALLVERGHAASVEHGVVHELLGVGPLLLGGAVTWWMVHALAAGGRADGAQEAA
jgi:exosortase/archaeosortase family protein